MPGDSRRKIAYVSSGRFPTERAFGYATMMLCLEFARAGSEVQLVIPDRRNDINQDPFAYYRLPPSFEIVRLSATDHIDGARRPIPGGFWIDLVTFMQSLRRFCRKERSTLFYLRDPLLSLVIPREQVVLELHSLPLRNPLFWHAVRRVPKVVVISDGLKRELIARGIRADRILVARDAVDLAQYTNLPSRDTARSELGIPQDARVALYTGHFYSWKGAEVFADAATFMPGTLCVLVGGVDEEYAALVHRAERRANVRIEPFLPRERIPLYLAAADVFVLPNTAGSAISERYTSPLKLFEYMAAGKPIIASDLPSIREVLDDTTAVFVAPGDPSALAEGVVGIIEDTELAQRLSQNACAAVDQYTWEKRAASILSFIATLTP